VLTIDTFTNALGKLNHGQGTKTQQSRNQETKAGKKATKDRERAWLTGQECKQQLHGVETLQAMKDRSQHRRLMAAGQHLFGIS